MSFEVLFLTYSVDNISISRYYFDRKFEASQSLTEYDDIPTEESESEIGGIISEEYFQSDESLDFLPYHERLPGDLTDRSS